MRTRGKHTSPPPKAEPLLKEKPQTAEKNTTENGGEVKQSLREMVGIEEFDKQTLNNIKMRKGIIVNNVIELEQHIEKALARSEKQNLYFGIISNNTKNKISRDLNTQVFKDKPYSFVVSYDDIIHISEHFGNDSSTIAKEIDAWVKEGKPDGETFILGSTGDILQGLGAIESDIYMLGDKINEILENHPEMTIEEIKKIPQILENPVLILKSQNVKRNNKANTRLVIFGNVKAQDGKPILSVLDLRPVEKNLVIDDMQKVSSAYTKDSNPIEFVRNSDVLYVDKKRATKLLTSIGFQMPIELHQSGYIGSISYFKLSVNIKGENFSKVFKENTVKNSDRDTLGNTLTEAQQTYFAKSKLVDEQGNLLRLYHGTENGGFTKFNPKYSDDGITLFLTPSRELANTYTTSNENVKLPEGKKGLARLFETGTKKGNGQAGIYEVYANVKNPYIMDCDGANWNKLPFHEKIKDATTLDTENRFDYKNNILYTKTTIDGEVYEKTFDLNHLVEPTNAALEETAKRINIDKKVQFKHFFTEQAETELREYYSTFANEKIVEQLWKNAEVAMELHDGITRTYRGVINNKTGNVEAMNTRFISKWAKENGYDGVWFKNIRDTGGASEFQGADAVVDVIVAYDGSQIKSVDNLNPTKNKDIRYADRDSIEFNEYAIQNALWEAFDHQDEGNDNLIKVSKMPQYIVDKFGIDGDFYIYRDHAYENMVSEEQAIADGRPTIRKGRRIHFHNLGIDTMTKAIASIENPNITIADKMAEGNPAVTMVLPVFDENDLPLYAVLSFYSNRSVNGVFTKKPHILLTIYGREYFEELGSGRQGLVDLVKDAIQDKRIIDFNRKKIREDLSVIAQRTRLSNITETSLNESLTQFRKEIKSFREKNKINYSDRDKVSVYDKIGEVDKLIKENEMLKEDVERLKERRKLEGQVTHGEYFNQNQLNAVAGYIRNIANSNFDKKNLASLIDDIYKYISHSPDLNWQDMYAKCYDVARMVLDEAKPVKVKNDYNEYVLKQISGATLYANEAQMSRECSGQCVFEYQRS